MMMMLHWSGVEPEAVVYAHVLLSPRQEVERQVGRLLHPQLDHIDVVSHRGTELLVDLQQ